MTRRLNEFTYDTGHGTVTAQVESRALDLRVHRSVLAQAFTMCMLLVNWALTIGTLYVTLVMLVRRERISEVVLALPITVVLTIPAIQALFVGSPPFGILGKCAQERLHKIDPLLLTGRPSLADVAGFLLQIILVALCSLALLYVVVNSSGSSPQGREKQKYNP